MNCPEKVMKIIHWNQTKLRLRSTAIFRDWEPNQTFWSSLKLNVIWIQDQTSTNALWFEENRKVIWESADCFRYIPINKAVKWGRWRGALIKTAVKLTFHTMMGGKNFYSLFINTMPVNITGGEGWLEELQKTSRESLVKRKAERKRRE